MGYMVDSVVMSLGCFFFQAEDGIRDLVRSRGLGDVYKRQGLDAIQRLDHSVDVGDRSLRLLGRHLQFELRVLVLSLIHI